MEKDLIFSSDTHVARVVVMETVSGKYRGMVYLRRADEDPEADHPHQTAQDHAREDIARDDAISLARKLLEEYEF